jgi:hypothetical protein
MIDIDNWLCPPGAWCILLDVIILDADGWRDGTSLNKPISLSEFWGRLVHCTISGGPSSLDEAREIVKNKFATL